ncbi:MAG: MBL fold metallo-hydrolase [Ruminococcaceae bacterium]|nr:MBL fold metallo-hydrolase [Oscillospiraceae bacterium]
MNYVKIPAFGETEFFEDAENKLSSVCFIKNSEEKSFFGYKELYEAEGFTLFEEYLSGSHRFAALRKDDVGVFINYFGGSGDISVVEEKECGYFSYSDKAGAPIYTPAITQPELQDFGLSYAVRLSDGRYLMIDGGGGFEPDSDELFRILSEGTDLETPTVAAWILSHPHSDHYLTFNDFMGRYGDRVKVEKLMFLFPEADDTAHFPTINDQDPRIGDISAVTNFPIMYGLIEKYGIPVFEPHTGQRYKVGDAYIEILASMDDTIHRTKNINASSLIFKMALGGQTVLFTTDGAFSHAQLPERYGKYLKSDILQIPHHGFQSGTAEAEIEGYKLVAPKVCLLPVSDYCAYTFFCTYKKGTRYIMRMDGVEEVISGDGGRTITLPYTPSPEARRETEDKFFRGLDDGGAQTWIFSELSTAREEDSVFSFLNMTIFPTTVYADIFFEESSRIIRFLKIKLSGGCIKILSIFGEEADGNALYFNGDSLKRKGIPENKPFAVRFRSDAPIVISHKDHKESYRSTVNR